jgi:hypothetical protein
MFFVSVIALFCAYTHSFSVLGKICEGWNCPKIGGIAPLKPVFYSGSQASALCNRITK